MLLPFHMNICIVLHEDIYHLTYGMLTDEFCLRAFHMCEDG